MFVWRSTMTTGILLTSAMAMNAQSHALGQISMNVANTSTTGYKRQETLFETLMSYGKASVGNTSGNIFTARVTDRKFVTNGGVITETGSRDDLAISGAGYFILSGNADGSMNNNNLMFTRAGDFQSEKIGNDIYLVTPSGKYVMGWNYNKTSKSFGNTLEPLKSTIPTEVPGDETKNLKVRANIDANGRSETSEKLSMTVYDSKFEPHVLTLNFKPTDKANLWDFTAVTDDGTVSPSITQVEFNSDGTMKSPEGIVSLVINWSDGQTGNVALDMTDIEQYAGETLLYSVINDGAPLGHLSSSSWDKDGILQATYTNSQVIPVCKVALADFVNPNMLSATNGTMYTMTTEAGEMTIMDLASTSNSTSRIYSSSLEHSNVSLEREFTNMITTQKAYTSASKVFQTGDEMYQTAIGILA